jgi:hypothetical protein
MRRRRETNVFSVAFLDLLSGALGAVIILYVAIPKNKEIEIPPVDVAKEEALQKELVKSKLELAKASRKIEELKESLVAASAPPAEETEHLEPKSEGPDLDMGFKFKGQSIVFVIDTSYSMIEEDRIGQVKAGLKMFLTSLSSSYKIDIVEYPFGGRAPFRTLWGVTKKLEKVNKIDAFDFIYRLKPLGGTPTRDTLLFVLRNYEDITDLVLLTDGVPTFHNSNKRDDIYEIMEIVKIENHRKVQISTIGVGTDFLSDKNSDQYKFLKGIADQHGGFFVGF